MPRAVYYISDGTGISAEALGHSLMTQFEQLEFHASTLPYIDNENKAYAAATQINKSFNLDKKRPIVFSTIVKPEIRNIIAESTCFLIDFFQTFIGTLEQELHMSSHPAVGLSHAVTNDEEYSNRIEAVNFALKCDDGVNVQAYQNADIILMGVSRAGKTPTCLYLALQFGIMAANYPLTEEELTLPLLPKKLEPFRSRLFGLTISKTRLHEIRSKRRPDSQYASLEQCDLETNRALHLFNNEKIPFLNSTQLSIEELSTQILVLTNLKR